ncbi:MAG: ABC transporter permease [Myxococcales bacterium]
MRPGRAVLVAVAGAAGAALLLFLLVPLVALAGATGAAGFLAGLRHPLVGPALRLSAATTLASLAAVVALGTPLAWILSRQRPSTARARRAWHAVEVLAQLPVVVPPAVAGVALLFAFGRRGLIGGVLARAGLGVAFTPAAVVLAEVFVSAPFYLQAALAAFRALDEDLLVVARSLGAGPVRLFFRVALPLSLQGLASGAALSWARALGEFGATLMFAGSLAGRTQTLPLAIYAALETDVRAAQAISLLLLAVAAALLFAVRAVPALVGRAVPAGPEVRR